MNDMTRTYYDLNIQIWEDSEGFLYSVIHEFDEGGRDLEILARGETETLSEAVKAAREAVLAALVDQ